VRALGTQFNIDRHSAGVTVSVLDGRVEVSNGSSTGQVLGAGQEARVGERGIIERGAAPNIKRRVAWRERRLEFQDDPLSVVVAEFNRYNHARRIRIEGKDVAAHTYTGILSADDPDSLAQVLSEEPGLVVERTAGEIVIRAR
jgi:transmembrane sensor